MEKYKNNEEAAKAYADLLQLDTNTEQGKLQYESACLDFAAGANWKDEQLRLSNVSQQRELLLAWEKSQYIEAGWNKSKDMVADKIDKYLANNCG